MNCLFMGFWFDFYCNFLGLMMIFVDLFYVKVDLYLLILVFFLISCCLVLVWYDKKMDVCIL